MGTGNQNSRFEKHPTPTAKGGGNTGNLKASQINEIRAQLGDPDLTPRNPLQDIVILKINPEKRGKIKKKKREEHI